VSLSSAESPHARALRLLDFTQLLCGALALGLFVVVLGWPLPDWARAEVARSTRLILLLFVAQELFRFALSTRRLALLRNRRTEALLAALAGIEILVGPQVVAWLQELGTGIAPTTITLLWLGGTQLTLLAALALRSLRDNRWLSTRSLTPGLVFILSFAALILLGALLLQMPHATRDPGLSWVDALFLATSAVCVTGLSPVDISSVLTPHGHWVLLALLQIGGLGVMTLTYFFAYFVAGGVSLRNRIGLQDLLSEENLANIGGVLALIVAFTAGVELVGAILIHQSLAGLPGAPENLPFFALFHSISAFCNAGFSTLSAGLADPRVSGHGPFLGLIMGLIILGGLGFPVVTNFWSYLVARVRRRIGLRVAAPPRLTAHSRVVLVSTAILIVGGALLIGLTEFVAGDGRATAAGDSPWLTALFHSVTARTAGFNVTPTETLLPASAVIIMFLMFVGGGPASTAGGIKTSTLAVSLLALRRVLLGREDIEAFGRRFPPELANRALSILIATVGFITVISFALCLLHPELPPEDLVFEAVSAVSTVGLSRATTPLLGDGAKLVLVFAMLVGRVGVLAFLISLFPRREATGLRLPETTIVLS
jgi:Trk-type K+ transport system membrane component